MFVRIKRFFYFPVAGYFRFFAKIQLWIWQPRVFVITGSSGKTTLLHLLESQIGSQAKYSHFANSSFGVPFDILGLQRKTLKPFEWPKLFLLTPIKSFQKIHTKKLYIVEADCDRVGEGKFLATLLKPEITTWLSSAKTHAANFPQPVEENIAKEFGIFLKYTSKLTITNGDLNLIQNQLKKSKSLNEKIYIKNLKNYHITKEKTEFQINGKLYAFGYLLPKETYYQIAAMLKILEYLNLPVKPFNNFTLPPGRSSVFEGVKNTIILDSSYNADLSSMNTMLNMFEQIQANQKWIVLGDMIEQGKIEAEEHHRLAQILIKMKLDKIILVGPRLQKYTYPFLRDKFDTKSLIQPKEALEYLKNNLSGGEMVFFKGARFLEGIIEHLLKNKSDISKLCRREKVWQGRRAKWGL